jgi:hypothetical protein
MSDYRDPNDPMYGNTGYEPAGRRAGTGWGWIAGAVFLAIILALAFGVGHEPSRVASNNSAAETTAPMAPAPSTNPSPSTVPGLAPPPLQQPMAPNRP